MITLEDVDRIIVDSSCPQRWPCIHSSTVILKNGRSASNLTGFEICAIVSALAKEKINPDSSEDTDEENWKADQVRKHFYDYSTSKLGWIAESAEAVLNRIFSTPT